VEKLCIFLLSISCKMIVRYLKKRCSKFCFFVFSL
jgi:hypothetical protein